jgi:hypothetical protein
VLQCKERQHVTHVHEPLDPRRVWAHGDSLPLLHSAIDNVPNL